MKRQHKDQAGSGDRTVKAVRRHAMAMLIALPMLATALAGCEDTDTSNETTQPAGFVETITTPTAVESEPPSEEPAAEPSPSPSPAPTTTEPGPVVEPAPAAPVAAAPVAAEPEPAPAVAPALDPKFKYCKDAIPAGYGNYVKGVDPEYDWYRDADGDGVVCEF
ncbi:excalibur calcium-binding domain-containing protein [Demequina lutea]|uniref:Excalibur calcium-binding domain-containing protein n=1 Tax=Demequina lutea TaxID=431489 RepID=A0A7Z0CLC6_9MICO|nr:excalibur calcium-binding domain-containing protein [Demequina lutea]NYI42630.1 hypothetical protein [Demequina lutea]